MIKVQNLTKEFKIHKKEPGIIGSAKSLIKRNYVTKIALNNLDLEINEGEIVGLIGSNGAGKTTLTKILSGIIHPSRGEVSVLGHKPWERENSYREQMAVIMGQKAQLWWDLPAMDGFLLLKEIYKIDIKSFDERIKYLAECLSIENELNTQVRRLSLGERMKVELMAALLHAPKVVFLDEPTIGLDLSAQKAVRAFLNEYRKEYKPTMILTSHYMEDIENLCERIVILKSGNKIYDGSISNLQNKYAFEKQLQVGCSKETAEKISFKLPLDLVRTEYKDEKFIIHCEKDQVMEVTNFLMSHEGIEDLSIKSEDLGNIIEKIMHSTESL